MKINITLKLKETIHSVNKALSEDCEIAPKQLIRRKQLELMTDASFRSCGYAFMIEDDPDQKIQPMQKRTPSPLAFGSSAQIKMSTYSKEFLAIYRAFFEFAHNLWQATKPTIVPTDKKCVTRFFQNEGSSASTVEWM